MKQETHVRVPYVVPLLIVETVSYRELIGANLRRLREDRNPPWLQEDVADIARRHGFPWRQSTVQAIESGKRELSRVEELLLQRFFPPLELHKTDGRAISFPGGGTLDPETFDRWVQERFKELPPIHYNPRRWEARAKERAHLRQVDRKVATSLGVDPERVSAAALKLWGHGLAEERSRQAKAAGVAPDKSEHMRLAWITRRLMDDLRAELKVKPRRKREQG